MSLKQGDIKGDSVPLDNAAQKSLEKFVESANKL